MALLAGSALCLASSAYAENGTWNADALGNWTDATKWTPGIPNGIGDVASLTYDITAARTVSLNGDKTIGALQIGDPGTSFFAYTLNSGTAASNNRSKLIFDQPGAANALITVPVVAGVAANSISAFRLQLNDPLVITTDFPNSATTQLAISAIISGSSGSYGLTKNGPGIIQLAGPNTYSGGTLVNAGRVNVNNVTAFGTGPVSIASGAQAFLNTASSFAHYTIAGLGYANSADTAAQAGAIRFANNRGVLGDVTVSAPARLGVDTTALGFIAGNLLGTAGLEINGPTTTTGGVTLLGSAAGYSGTLSLARGSFSFPGALGGSLNVAPVAGATTTLGAGTAIGGGLTLDSSLAAIGYRNNRGPLAVAGNLHLLGSTPVTLATLPPPGTSSLTVLTYASRTGAGTLTFDATGFRGSPTLTVGATAAVISGLDAKTLTWANTLGDGLWNVNSAANWTGGDTKFFQGDAVVFGDAAPGTVTLEGTLRPQSVTFNSQAFFDYLVLGPGGLDGVGGGLIKNGGSTVILASSNNLTGPVLVNAGRLSIASAGALGFTPGVTVASGATFDVNGQRLLTASRAVDVTIAGTGDGTLPALANGGTNIAFGGSATTGIRNVTLAADATIGGPAGRGFDISGLLDGAGHTLTKVGGNLVYLLGPARNLRTVIAEGSLACFNTDGFGSSLRVESGATAQASTGGTFSPAVTLASGGRLELVTGSETLWTGPITAEGDVELVNNNTVNTSLAIAQAFTVPGNLKVNSTGSGTVTLLNDVSVAGDVSVIGASLMLGNGVNSASLLVTGPGGLGGGSITVTANAALRGPGSVPVTTTVNAGGLVAPGTATTIGTLTTGASGRTTTINGTLRIKGAGSATDALKATGPLTLGTNSQLEFTLIGAPLTAPAYVIATYATLNGTFGSVTGLPAGYSVVYDYNDGFSLNNIALVKVETYAEWIGGFYPGETDPLIIGPNADPDGDGIPNLVENYLGTSPKVPSAGLTQVSVVANSLFCRHSRADAPLTGYTASYQWSTDLAAWHPSDATADGVTVTIGSFVAVDNPPPQNDEIQVIATVLSGNAPKLFVRLILTPN